MGFQVVHLAQRGHRTQTQMYGDILRDRRRALGLTQKQVAEKVGIPFQNYQAFEKGTRNIRTASFTLSCKILEALELDIAKFYHDGYLLGEEVCFKDHELCFTKSGRPMDEEIPDDAD